MVGPFYWSSNRINAASTALESARSGTQAARGPSVSRRVNPHGPRSGSIMHRVAQHHRRFAVTADQRQTQDVLPLPTVIAERRRPVEQRHLDTRFPQLVEREERQVARDKAESVPSLAQRRQHLGHPGQRPVDRLPTWRSRRKHCLGARHYLLPDGTSQREVRPVDSHRALGDLPVGEPVLQSLHEIHGRRVADLGQSPVDGRTFGRHHARRIGPDLHQ